MGLRLNPERITGEGLVFFVFYRGHAHFLRFFQSIYNIKRHCTNKKGVCNILIA